MPYNPPITQGDVKALFKSGYKKIKKLNRLFWALVFTPIVLLCTAPFRAHRKRKFQQSGDPQTILISFFGRGLGDCIYFSGALKFLRARFPKAKIQLAFLKQFESYFGHNPYVDEFIACPDYFESLPGTLKFYQSAWQVRRRGPVDLFLNLCPTLMMAPVFWDYLIPKRYSIAVGDSLKRLFYDTPVPIDWKRHYYECTLNGLEPLGITARSGEAEFWIPPDVPVDHLIPDASIFSKTIIVAPGGRRNVEETKEYCWIFKEFPDVINQIAAQGYPIIVTGAGYDLEIVDKIKPQPSLINLIGKTTVREIFTLVKKYGSLIVANNSGLMHIASIQGVPTVSYADPQENMIRWCAYPNKNDLHIFCQDTETKKVTAGELLGAVLSKATAIKGLDLIKSNPENRRPF